MGKDFLLSGVRVKPGFGGEPLLNHSQKSRIKGAGGDGQDGRGNRNREQLEEQGRESSGLSDQSGFVLDINYLGSYL